MMIAVITLNIIAIIAMIFATRELNKALRLNELASRAIERVSSSRRSARESASELRSASLESNQALTTEKVSPV